MADESLLSELFESHPTATFLADDDVHLLLANRAARALLGPGERIVLAEPRRAGDLVHCSHTTEHPDGCGRGEHCKTCVVRTAVAAALASGAVAYQRGELDLRRDDSVRVMSVVVSATPVARDGARFALLTVAATGTALPVLPG